MLKSLTFGLSLVLALGLTGVSKAGGFFNKEAGCTTCGLASPQGDPVVSAQSPTPSAQGGGHSFPSIKKCDLFSGLGHKLNCLSADLEGFKHNLCEKLKPKPKVYTYEWVLKKKRVWGHKGLCDSPSCDTCGTLPSSQSYPSAQGAGSPQSGYTSPQATANYGSGQIVPSISGQMSPAPTGYSATPISSTPAAPLAADEPPPAPAVPAATPATPAASTPAPEAPAAPEAPKSSLLFSTPSGN